MKRKHSLLFVFTPTLIAAFIFSCSFISSAFAIVLPGGGGFWNTNLRMVNVLELENPSDTRQVYTIEAYDNLGNKFATHSYSLSGHAQRDINLNDVFLQGRENQIGIIVIAAVDVELIVARMTYYRWNASGSAVEFAFSVPAEGYSVLRVSTTSVPFNSIQPSFNAADANAPIDQWLSIVNLSETSEKYTINTYNQGGTLISTQDIYLKSHERRDILAGDTTGNAESALIGQHQIVPAHEDTFYAAQLVRYGKKGGSADEYAFAVPILSTVADYPFVAVPVGTGKGADNYVELANAADVEEEIGLFIIGFDGSRKLMQLLTLQPHQQIHVNAGLYLNEGQSGIFVATQRDTQNNKTRPYVALAATGVAYYRNADGSIKATTSSPTVFPFFEQAVTSYNLYLDSDNWLRLFGADEERATVTLNIADEAGDFTTKEISIQSMRGVDLPLHEFAEYNTVADSYGEILIEGAVMGEMLRLGGARSGDIDFAISTPIGYIGLLI